MQNLQQQTVALKTPKIKMNLKCNTIPDNIINE